MIDKILSENYSKEFDMLRLNRVKMSFHKYGTAKINFGQRLVNALETQQKCIDKYKATGNTEYLVDAANYLMFEFMYPQQEGAYFKATESKDSAGIVGFTIKEMEDMKNETN